MTTAIQLTAEQWIEEIDKQIQEMDFSQWRLGDKLLEGEIALGEKVARVKFESRFKIPWQSVKNYVWVARQIPAVRRLTSLSWSHHQVVAGLSEPDQTKLLARAEAEKLSVRDLRDVVVKKQLPDKYNPANEEQQSAFNSVKWANEGIRWFRGMFDSKPLDEWEPEQRVALKSDLKPLVDIYNQL